LLLLDYAETRIHHPEQALWLRQQIRPYFLHAGIRPTVQIDRTEHAPLVPIEILARRDGDTRLIALQLNPRAGGVAVPWNDIYRAGPVPISLQLPGTFSITDMLTGTALGRHNALPVSVSLDSPVLLRLDR